MSVLKSPRVYKRSTKEEPCEVILLLIDEDKVAKESMGDPPGRGWGMLMFGLGVRSMLMAGLSVIFEKLDIGPEVTGCTRMEGAREGPGG